MAVTITEAQYGPDHPHWQQGWTISTVIRPNRLQKMQTGEPAQVPALDQPEAEAITEQPPMPDE